jgi:signal transduction histidine kinase
MRRKARRLHRKPGGRQEALPQASNGQSGLPGSYGPDTDAFGRDERRRLEELIRALQRDRQLTAYEIHDGLVQDVTGAQMQLESLLGGDGLPPGPVYEKVSLAWTLIREAVVEARHLIDGLRPPVLNELGLVAAIEYLIDE